MGGVRGRAQNGKTGQADPSVPVRAQAVLKPGEPARVALDDIVSAEDCSAAEAVRIGLITYRAVNRDRIEAALQEAE